MEHNNDRGERREKAQTVRRNSLEKNTLYNTAGSLFYLFCQWLLTLIVVHAGGYEDAGNFSLAMSNTNVLFTLATFGLQHYVISDRNNEFTPSEYLSTRLSTAAAAVVICAAVTLLNGRYTAEQKTCIILYMLYRAAEALIDMLQAIEYRAERMDYAFVSFILRGLGILAGFPLLLRFAGSLPQAILALAAVSFVKIMLIDGLLMKNPGITVTVATVVCLTLLLTVVVAKLVGCSLPLLAKRVGFDPAVMASPFITTIVDALSLILYFRIATDILHL